jgi:quinolinate synthase
VHARFSTDQIAKARIDYPDVQVIVHPECRHEVVAAADFDGSTEYIINTITAAPSGTTWAVGTEINLVRRLQNRMPDKTIFCLDPVICPCSTMYRIHTAYILWALEHLERGEVVNEIRVDDTIRANALIALNRMLALP